jgi:DNA-directed RNA polymerase subunit RPC12/RpoP
MSEFKFACPVCGQHITADSSNSGGHIACPTCFQKIIVPQAPSSADPKFILSATQVGKPRPVGTANGEPLVADTGADRRKSLIATIALVVVVGAAGGTTFAFRDKIFKSNREQVQANGAGKKAAPPKVYPIPTNINWTMSLSEATIPEETAVGSIHASGFYCERATLQGGHLTLRQGRSGPADLGITVQLFAHEGEELSGKTVEIQPDRAPPLPKIVLRWKDEQQKAVTRNINNGYALKVAFGEAASGRIPGKIYISLPDENKSFVAGTFNAEIRKAPPPKTKQPTASPGPPGQKPARPPG